LRFGGLVKGDGRPRIKLEGDKLYIVVPERSKVQQRFLGWCLVYHIEYEGDVWCFKVKLGGSALGDWIEPIRPSEWNELTASRGSRRGSRSPRGSLQVICVGRFLALAGRRH